MKRRKFLKSSAIIGGVAATASPMGLVAGTDSAPGCDETGSVNKAMAGLKKLGRVQPKSSDQIQESYWGIQAGAFDDDTLDKARGIGIKWTRITIGWDGVEREKGQFDWSRFDSSLDALLRYGITPFVTLTRGNRLYTGTGRYDDPRLAAIYGDQAAPPTDEAGMKGWLVFVETAINRYKDRIKYWEVWNEPNHRNYWGAPPNGPDYGKLVKVTSWSYSFRLVITIS